MANLDNKIAVKQIKSGQLVTFITGVTNPLMTGYVYPLVIGASGALQAQINQSGISASGASGIFQSNFRSATGAVTSGVEYQTFSYGYTFPTTPKLVFDLKAPSGSPYLVVNEITKTLSGVHLGFSNYVPNTGYYITINASL